MLHTVYSCAEIYLGAAILECSYRALQRVATVHNQSLTLQLCFGFKSLLPVLREPRQPTGHGQVGGRPWPCPSLAPGPGPRLAVPQQPLVGEPLLAEHDLLSSCLKAFGPMVFFFSLGCCSMFFQHFLFQMKPKEYNPEQEVLITRDPSPALAAERYLRWSGLRAPVTALLLTSVLEPLMQSTFPVMMVLSNGETGVFQKPKGEDPGAVSEERVLFLSKD